MTNKDLKDARRIQAEFGFEDVAPSGRRGGPGRQHRDRENQEAPRERSLERDAESSAQARRRQAFSGMLSSGNASTPRAATPNVPVEPEDADSQTKE